MPRDSGRGRGHNGGGAERPRSPPPGPRDDGPIAQPRIAVAFEYPSLNGGERSFLAVADRLRERFDLVALAPPAGPLADELRRRGVPLFAMDGRGKREFLDAYRTARPDLIHGNSLAVGRILGRLADDLPCPTTAHLRDILNLSAAATRDLNRNRGLVAVSAATREHHVARGLDPSITRVVHNGIDAATPTPSRTRDAVRAECGVRDGVPVLLTVGQIGLRKGWDTLAGAAAKVPHAHFLLAGTRFSRKAESARYEAAARRTFAANADGRHTWLGVREDVPDLMAAADLLIHPARQEPFGRVLLEAAAAALVVVATDVGGTREMLGEGFAAVPPDDPPALAAAVTGLLADAPARTALAAAARERVTVRFTLERAADGLARTWEDALP